MREFIKKVSTRRRELRKLLGDIPSADRRIRVVSRKPVRQDGYLVERLTLDLNGIEDVPALLIKRADGPGRKPGILYCHSHGGFYDLGKRELLEGVVYEQKPPYGYVLADRGYAVLCIDNWAFGKRRTMTESATFKLMLWQGRTMWGMMVYDNLRALDYMRSRQDIDGNRIAALGMSMGSTMSWWVAALDPKVSACVDICCLTDFQALIDEKGLDGHGIFYYVPSLLKYFSTAEINALISPRPHLSLAGVKDKLTPVKGLDRIDRELKKIYKAAGKPENWQLVRYPGAHRETPDMRRRVLAFLDLHLRTRM